MIQGCMLDLFENWGEFEKELIELGVCQNSLSFLHFTSLPRDDPEWLDNAKAKREYFPGGVNQISANLRVLRAAQQIMFFLWNKQKDLFQKDLKQTIIRPTLKKKINDNTIKLETERYLKSEFRILKKIGGRGRLSIELQEESNQYIKRLFDATFERARREAQTIKDFGRA